MDLQKKSSQLVQVIIFYIPDCEGVNVRDPLPNLNISDPAILGQVMFNLTN